MIDAIFIIFILSLFTGVYIQWRAIQILKVQFTEKWESLGRPNIINNSASSLYKLHKFVWKKQYVEMNDPKFLKLCSFLRHYQIFCLVLLPVLFILFVFALCK